MSAADARAMRPALRLAPADPQADAALLERLCDWSRRYTPLAAPDAPCGLLLDITGASHLFGGEAAMCGDVLERLRRQGFAARAAIAPGPALARALARFAPQILPPAATQAQIDAIAGALPIAALGLADDAPALRAGLARIGDFLSRPRAPLAARFGKEALARLDALTCRRRDPVTPRFEAADFMVERRFPEGLTAQDAIEAALTALCADLCHLLERHGLGARRLAAAFFRVDGAVKHLRVGASRPLREPARLASLLRERLAVLAEDGLDTGCGFDVLRLEASQTQPLDSAAAGFFEPPSGEAFEDMLDRLAARLGPERVLRLSPQAAHVPELAVTAVPARAAPAAPWPQEEETPPRPLRLFETPEPVEALALAPDGPPMRFRWRRALHETANWEGPERIAPQWWTDFSAATRDYFHVEDKEGRRFWLFRDGLYDSETPHPRWFLHGLW